MRITGGRVRGRRLATFRGLEIRPTSDLVREAIFNLLGRQSLLGMRVLDLFAGTGSLGIEALSRGADHAVFVDCSRKAIEIIKKNLRLCDLQDLGVTLRKDLTEGLPGHHPLFAGRYDLVFLDPPYGRGLILPLLNEMERENRFGAASLVVAQTEKSTEVPQATGNLRIAKVKTYGATRITLLEKEEDI
ncbi:MAG: 16S rRNA (guanine(966)-N(2))-methyltransferase RsmD [Deltaproteobacteria bacterium]|nr:16S rRNA (guanine(966)-N(2))-methyltransferase RsmD [Deltaproteobacteria bacterium]